MKTYNILGFAGSLREKSFNKALLRSAKEISPDNFELELFPLDDIPLYNDDLTLSHLPETVRAFREKIEKADGLLIASPEYNFSISGVLKNALDWTRSQLHLRQVLFAANANVINRPQVLVRNAGGLVDEAGNLQDADTIDRIGKLLTVLLEALKSQ
jgi:chromate reductase